MGSVCFWEVVNTLDKRPDQIPAISSARSSDSSTSCCVRFFTSKYLRRSIGGRASQVGIMDGDKTKTIFIRF